MGEGRWWQEDSARAAAENPIYQEFTDPSLVRLSLGLSRVLHWVVLWAGLMVVAGWFADVEFLKRVFPGLPAMMPGSASCLILLSIAGLIHFGSDPAGTRTAVPASRWVSRVLALGVFLWSALSMAQYPLGVDFGIDQWLIEIHEPANRYPGRPSPQTLLSFLLLSSALLLEGTRRWRISGYQFLSASAMLVGIIALTGYLLGTSAFYTFGVVRQPVVLTGMAIHTGLGALFLGVGFLAGRPMAGNIALMVRRTLGGRMARRIVAVGLLMPPVLSVTVRAGEAAGFYDLTLRTSITLVGSLLIMIVIAWMSTVRLEQEELARIRNEEKLSKAIELANEANRVKNNFLANMSHEIRTPLTAVLGFAGIIAHEKGHDSESREYAERIERNAEHLKEIVDDILDLAKVEAGTLDVERRPVEIRQVFRHAFEDMKSVAKGKGIGFEAKVRGGVPKVVYTDPLRLRQILLNIIGNAVKFTDRGEVRVVADCSGGGRLRVRVQDTGSGISSENRNRLFQPFVQADSSSTRRFGGSGLGLALSRRLARMLGGDVELVRSEPERGSEFLITVNGVGLEERAAETREGRKKVNLEGVRVLVAEDDEDMQMLVTRILTSAGARVRVVSDGAQAVESVVNNHFDLILMDISMPGLDGLEAVKIIRKQGVRTPVIAVTARAMRTETDVFEGAGFDAFVTKPYRRQDLFATLQRVLERRETPAA